MEYKPATIEKRLDKTIKKMKKTEEGKALAAYVETLRKKKRYVYDISNNMAEIGYWANMVQDAIGD